MSWKPTNKPNYIPGWLPAPIRWGLKWGCIGLVLLLLIVMYYAYLASQFDMSKVTEMPERSVMIDRNGKEFAWIHGQRRKLIKREDIPDVLVHALYAREDLHFPTHIGIDGKGLLRATWRNIKDRSFTQGASTLTMQLARNSYNMRAKSLHRKLLEMALTLRIEQNYTKDEILTAYLNRIYFGAGCHGVEEASMTYFGRSVSKLNTGESAMLVGIIRGPHVFSPFRNFEAALAQRDEVLNRMVKTHFLTKEEAEQAKLETIHLVPEKKRNRQSSYVRASISRQLQLILDQHDIRDGGLKIYTTLDATLQKRCESLLAQPMKGLESKVPSKGGIQCALVKMDMRDGGVLAMCGGRTYEGSPLNRAYRAKRDLGPAFEPFLMALAMERGKVAISGEPVQTGRQLGVKETIRLAKKRLGFSGPFLTTEDLFRGGIAASPMETSVALSTLGNQGKRPTPYFIVKITDSQGKVLYSHEPSGSQALSKNAASDALSRIKKRDGVRQLIATTGSKRDAWGLEVHKAVATVFWMGYDKPRKLGDSKTIKSVIKAELKQMR